MGITTAQFTLAAGIMSFVGGDLMSIDIRGHRSTFLSARPY